MTAGDPARRTGGNLYNRHMLAALRRAGIRVTTVILRDRRDTARLRDLRARVVLVDTIAAAPAAPHLARLRRRGAEVIALAHMWQGALVLARRADGVIAVSRALADELVSHGIARRRIVVITPGRGRIAPRPGSGIRGRVLCVANWTPAKAVHRLVAAAARLPEVSLDLVGDAPDAAYASKVRRSIAMGALTGRVREYGSLAAQALARRYAAASVFVLPSTREAYGIVYAEALAHGLPVIGCDIPAAREVTRGAAILVPPGKVAPLASAIALLLRSDRTRRRLAQRGLRRARRLPTWRQTEARLVRVLAARVRRGAGSPRN